MHPVPTQAQDWPASLRVQARTLVETFILEELLYGAGRSDLDDGTRLLSDGLIDSLSCLRLHHFLESTFGITIPPDQIDAEHFDSVAGIVNCIEMNRRPARARPDDSAQA